MHGREISIAARAVRQSSFQAKRASWPEPHRGRSRKLTGSPDCKAQMQVAVDDFL
jgi:hypothetical protein